LEILCDSHACREQWVGGLDIVPPIVEAALLLLSPADGRHTSSFPKGGCQVQWSASTRAEGLVDREPRPTAVARVHVSS
jgi:hypothetical protein